MYLPVEPGRLIKGPVNRGPVNRGPENRGCTVIIFGPSQLSTPIYSDSSLSSMQPWMGRVGAAKLAVSPRARNPNYATVSIANSRDAKIVKCKFLCFHYQWSTNQNLPHVSLSTSWYRPELVLWRRVTISNNTLDFYYSFIPKSNASMQTNPRSINIEMLFLTAWTGANTANVLLTTTCCIWRMICENIFPAFTYVHCRFA